MQQHNPDDPVVLSYAKDFCGEWVLLVAKASNHVKTVLRTAGWSALCDHPISTEGLDDKNWKWAVWAGKYDPETETFTGNWSGH